MPGASPDVMAASVATPLERHLGIIADVSEMTSENTIGQTRITLQFGLDRDIDGAARDVQAAINAWRKDVDFVYLGAQLGPKTVCQLTDDPGWFTFGL